MKKLILLLLCSTLSLQVLADCRPYIEERLVHEIISQKRLVKAGKITTGATFVTVGGFWGAMGVYMLGPLWAGAVIGSTFGAAAALPVGATFVIANKVKKNRIRNYGRTLSIINHGEEFDLLHAAVAGLSREELERAIETLNSSGALCDGSLSRTKKIATPKDIIRFLNAETAPLPPLLP